MKRSYIFAFTIFCINLSTGYSQADGIKQSFTVTNMTDKTISVHIKAYHKTDGNKTRHDEETFTLAPALTKSIFKAMNNQMTPAGYIILPDTPVVLAPDNKGIHTFRYNSNKNHGGLQFMEITDISDPKSPKILHKYDPRKNSAYENFLDLGKFKYAPNTKQISGLDSTQCYIVNFNNDIIAVY